MEEANSNSNGKTAKTPRAVPPLLAHVEVSNLSGFDVTPTPSPHAPHDGATTPSPRLPKKPSSTRPGPGPGAPPLDRVARRSEVVLPPLDSPFQAPGYRSSVQQPISISLPASPTGFGAAATPMSNGGGDSADGLRRQALLANAAAAREPPQTPSSAAAAARENGGGGGSIRFSHQPTVLGFGPN